MKTNAQSKWIITDLMGNPVSSKNFQVFVDSDLSEESLDAITSLNGVKEFIVDNSNIGGSIYKISRKR
jgi:hypothetical protein